jgi:hypothetical protein
MRNTISCSVIQNIYHVIYSRPWLRTTFDWCLIDMYSIRTTSNYKGMIIETLIYENQNLTHWYLSSKMPLVTHQLGVLSRDMFSSKCVYGTYAKTSLLARRPLPSSCVERMEHQTQSPRLLLKRHYEHLQI